MGDTVHELFADQAAGRRDAIAVTDGTDRLSYRKLDRRANQIAHHLRTLGVRPDVPVGVRVARSPALITALLGVLKAGGAYLPLDPAHPPGRLADLMTDARARVLLTDAPDTPLAGDRVATVDVRRTAVGPDTPPAAGVHPDHLAYVMYTSGSTGAPKGVLVEHRQVTRLFTCAAARFRFGPDDVWTLFHSPAFDFSVWEMWGALLYGGRLVVVPPEVARAPEEFFALLCRERVTVLNQTPAAFRSLLRVAAHRAGDTMLRMVIFGGEALTPGMVRPWLAPGGPELINMYGITETTVHATWHRLTAADLARPDTSVIGTALPDVTAEVLALEGTPAPVGTAGELYIGGAGMARGYLGRPELTAERFQPSPHGGRRYRTGDRARRLPGGELEFLGRLDAQVKIRGYRIEPAEVEAALATHPAVREAAVVAGADPAGERRLVAYWTAADGDRPDTSRLREHLAGLLPEFMVPSVFVPLETLPLTANGKLDRSALPDPDGARPEPAGGFASPGTPLEETVARIWAGALAVDRVGLDDDFFELGGHSLLATQVVARTGETLGVRVSLRLLFDQPTVRGFTSALARTVSGSDPQGTP